VPDDRDDARVDAALDALIDAVLDEEPEADEPVVPPEQQFHLLYMPAGVRPIDGVDKLIRVEFSLDPAVLPDQWRVSCARCSSSMAPRAWSEHSPA
jgi:hypothetical protein